MTFENCIPIYIIHAEIKSKTKICAEILLFSEKKMAGESDEEILIIEDGRRFETLGV